jgi:hypothetical protein
VLSGDSKVNKCDPEPEEVFSLELLVHPHKPIKKQQLKKVMIRINLSNLMLQKIYASILILA